MITAQLAIDLEPNSAAAKILLFAFFKEETKHIAPSKSMYARREVASLRDRGPWLA